MSENKQHPNALLLAQLARDALKTTRPQDWWEVYYNGAWRSCGNPDYTSCFLFEVSSVRRRPQWTIDGLAVGQKINVGNDPYVYEINAFQCNGFEDYAIITYCAGTKLKFFKSDVGFKKYEPLRTMKINGFEVPEPMKFVAVGTKFFYPDFGGKVQDARFSIMSYLHRYLHAMGLCHATHEAAEIHSQALDSFRLKGGES